jgi:arginase family enzyme
LASAISTNARKDLVRNSGVHVFTMKDIDRLGVAAVAPRRCRL